MGEISKPFIVKNGFRRGNDLSSVLYKFALEKNHKGSI